MGLCSSFEMIISTAMVNGALGGPNGSAQDFLMNLSCRNFFS